VLAHVWIPVTSSQQRGCHQEHDYAKRSAPVDRSPPALETPLNCLQLTFHCLPSLPAALGAATALNPLQNRLPLATAAQPFSSE
jgi:hypothetical protein